MIGAILLLALGVALVTSGSDDPSRNHQDGLRTINCYGSTPENTVSVPIKVEFQEHGRTAILRFGQDTFRLPFQYRRLLEDVYGNGAIELRIDPEVYLSGLREG